MKELFWKNLAFKRLKPAQGEISCDYLIVGGGISGVMTAYQLAKEKAGSIVLVEKDTIGSGATGFSAGMILTELEGTNSEELTEKFGKAFTREYWNQHNETYDELKSIISKEHIDCDIHEGDVYVLAHGDQNALEVTKDILARQKVDSYVEAVNLKEIKKDFNIEGYSFGEKTHKGLSVNPLKLVQGILLASIKSGVQAFENTAVSYPKEGDSFVTTSTGAKINFKHIIYTTDSYDKKNPIDHFKSSIAVTRKLSLRELRLLKLEDYNMMIENELFDYCYLKVTGDKRILVGCGDVLTKSTAKDHTPHKPHIKKLQTFIKKIFPSLDLPFEYEWSGMYGLTRDIIPHFETDKKSSRVCGSGLQLTSMVMAKYLVHSLVKKTKHPFDKVYR